MKVLKSQLEAKNIPCDTERSKGPERNNSQESEDSEEKEDFYRFKFTHNDKYQRILKLREQGIDYRTLPEYKSPKNKKNETEKTSSFRTSENYYRNSSNNNRTLSPKRDFVSSSIRSRGMSSQDCPANLVSSGEGDPITRDMMVDPALVEPLNDKRAPVSVNIQKQLFAQAQHSENKLTNLKSCGTTYLFNDKNAGIVVAKHGLPGGSKYRHII